MRIDQLDYIDAEIRIVGQPAYDPNRFDYFDDMNEYDEALASIGKDPNVSRPHELAHGKCALAVGAIGVKYGIEYVYWESEGQHFRIPHRAVTSILGPSRIPNLGLAAICAAPTDPSRNDLINMERLKYHSIEELEERIVRWNRQDNGLIIPMPGTIDVSS